MRLRADQIAEVNKKIDAAVAEFIKGIPQQVNKLLTGAMCSALGITNRWGDKFEVDGTNGREPLIATLVKDAALPEAQKVVNDVALATIAEFRRDQKMIMAIMVEAQKRYREHLRSSVLGLAEQAAKSDAQEIVDKLGPVVFQEVPAAPGELCDPATGSKSVTSEALLERLAREFVSREEIACGVGVAEGSELSSGDLPGPG